METRLHEIVEEIEEQQRLIKKRGFHSTLNQPNLISVSSANATDVGSADSFYKFTANMPRPALDVDTIQLVNANIPQCVQNIPDTACGFWYYRLSAYSGNVPSVNNLHFVRLLPSYYRQEFITNPQLYGYNVTFNTYQNVETQLALSCSNDLGYTNYIQDLASTLYYSSQFSPQDITITYNSSINKFQTTGFYAFKTPAWEQWNNATAYAVGDQVYFTQTAGGGIEVSYICLIANTNEQPDNSPTYWLQNNQPVIVAWSSTTTYGIGRYASYNTILYVSNLATLNNRPDISPAYWAVVDEAEVVWNRYLLTGYDDPNVKIAQSKYYTPYDNYTLFENNTCVEYNNQFYTSTTQTIGIPPPSANWTLESATINNLFGNGTFITVNCDNSTGTFAIADNVYITGTLSNQFNSLGDPTTPIIIYVVIGASATQVFLNSTIVGSSSAGILTKALPLISGLNEFSKKFDMDLNVSFLPVGIPPQPFNPNPRRLLNSILGFTWNGVFSPQVLQNITANTLNIIPTISTNLYNRLRPVPFYVVDPNALSTLLGDIPAITTQTYTAEGYCNLVYSSIMNIYASIVYGSTLDTQRNTSLLAQGTMDCGNLGVSFFNPFINNPLKVSGSDIYDIGIEILDECGEPYVLTNNAITTFVLRVAYKKDNEKKITE